MLYFQDLIPRRLGFSRRCPQTVEFGIGGDPSFPGRRGHSIDVKLRHDAVVKGRSDDEVERQLVLLEQCFELLPRLRIAGHNSCHLFANLRHQTPIEGARATGLQNPRLDHARQYGVEDGNLHPPQSTNLPLGLHDVARQQCLMQAARLDVGQDKSLRSSYCARSSLAKMTADCERSCG